MLVGYKLLGPGFIRLRLGCQPLQRFLALG
jgi:hypothetical protein